LPVIDDGDRDLSRLRVVDIADIAGDAHAVPAGPVQRSQCLMVVVVDVGKVAQLRRRQFLLHSQEPPLPRRGAEPGEAVGEQRSVRAADLPDQHRRPVTQHGHSALGGTDQAPAGGQPGGRGHGDYRPVLHLACFSSFPCFAKPPAHDAVARARGISTGTRARCGR
jgi:hypothetical protein